MNVIVDGVIFENQWHGGVSRIYSEILPRMCKADSTLQVNLVISGCTRGKLPEHSGIQLLQVAPLDQIFRPRRFWGPIRLLIREVSMALKVRDVKEQIWHSTYYTLPWNWQGPVVVTVLDMIHERFDNLFSGWQNDYFRHRKKQNILRADAIVCISEATKGDVEEFYDIDEKEKLHVIPLAYSPIFRQLEKDALPKDLFAVKPFIMFLGSRASYKNFTRVLQAYSRWPMNSEVDLVVVGTPWTSREKVLLSNLNIASRVHLLVNAGDQDLSYLYNLASAFVYPALYEGFGIPLLEAMACGCPVVASHIPSSVEVANDCPIYFDPIDTESLITSLDLAIQEGRNSERVSRGLQRVKTYSWESTAKKTLGLYYALFHSR